MRHDGMSTLAMAKAVACGGWAWTQALAGLALHDAEVGLRLARADARAGELVAVEVDEAHVLGRHETLADERGRAEREVVADADGDVAAVAVGVVALPEAAAHVADAELQILHRLGVEEALDVGRRFRVGAGLPPEFVVGNGGLALGSLFASGEGREGGTEIALLVVEEIAG
jgi:hypothetical protein